MSWKGIKCVGCGRDIGCPHCGQLLPYLSIVTKDGVGTFCTSNCRDKWEKENRR